MQPFLLAGDIERRYGEYVQTTFPFLDKELAEQLKHKIEHEHLLGTGPILSLQRPFAPGESVADLAAGSELHPTVAKIFEGWELRELQVRALRRLSERGGFRHVLMATGTGSGKTEAFLLPILDYCARHPGEGVKALLIYPMNALANDQLERLRHYLNGTGITFARYTGDTPAADGETHPGVLAPGQAYRDGGPIPPEECFSREAIRKRLPNILITGYRMLEYLLVRREDQKIFRPGGAPAKLRYLVLDEAHTYTGALGAEVACLVRRLRGHVDRHGNALTCVAASATVGEDQADDVLAFASKLFAAPFDRDALIQEFYAPTPASDGAPALEPISDEELDTLAISAAGAVPQDEAQMLYAQLDPHPAIVWLRRELITPQAFDDLVERFAKAVASHDLQAARRHLIAYLLRGTIARNADGPLLRPRLHVIYRGLAGASRCLRCGEMLQNGEYLCPRCESRALPIEICRQCGQDYLRASLAEWAGTEPPRLSALTDFDIRVEEGDLREASPTTLRFVTQLHELAVNEDDEGEGRDEDDASRDRQLIKARVCTDPRCGHVSLREEGGPCAKCECPDTAQLFLVRLGKMRECAACRYRYGLDREPITTLSSSTAIGVSILTWLTLARLPLAERKLLVFADSRQDTAYQAGYLQDITAEYSWRQVVYRVIHESSDPPDFEDFWKRLYKEGRARFEIFAKENQQRQYDELHFFLVQEFTREATRRTSLENLGLVRVGYRELEHIVNRPAFERFRAACAPITEGRPFSNEELVEALATVLDFMRHAGALDDEFARKFWEDVEEMRGLDRYNRRPVAYRRATAPPRKEKYATIKPLVGSKGRPTAIERFIARLGVADPAGAIASAADVLEDDGYLTDISVGGTLATQKVQNVLAVNAGLLSLEEPPQLWQCTNCGTVNLRNVRGRCYRATCEGDTLRPMSACDDSNFYVHMYRRVDPIRLEAREHSGQLSGAKREEYEREFRAGKVNVLVASPTLELGVDIGALTTVLLRGLPPSPANYTQRAGRAGRQERIALVGAYAQNQPHDNYFFNYPAQMIAGRIAAPQFELDNATIVRRHIRSLALEKLERQLPTYMKAFLDLPDKERLSPEDYASAKLVTRLDALDELRSKREVIVEAVHRAFREEAGFTCLSAEEVRRVIDEFEHDLWNVLLAWHTEVVQVATEIARINQIAAPSNDERNRRAQLERTLMRLTAPPADGFVGSRVRSEAYVLGYLANHGFLPSYAFPGEPATLFSRDLDDAEIQRDPLLALQEFAPGAIVYVDGKKIRSIGLNLVRALSGPVDQYIGGGESRYYRCTGCGHHAKSAWIGQCPGCGEAETMQGEERLEAQFFRGTAAAQINASEEYRSRTPFDMAVALLGEPASCTTYRYETLRADYLRRQTLLAINRGPRRADGSTEPFVICLECGDVQLPGSGDDWDKRHIQVRKHKPRKFVTHLTYEFESDTLELSLPGLSDDAALTLRYALLAATRIEYQADEDEIRGFELPPNEKRPLRTILFETVNGGAGYLRRAVAHLPRLAARAIEIISHEQPCVAACYQCLLTYYNQRDHGRIDKRLIESTLRALAFEPTPTPSYEAAPSAQELLTDGSSGASSDGRAESPIEVLLDAAMRKNLSGYALQEEIRDPDTNAVVSRPDILFGHRRVAVYADGKAFHSSPEQIEHDTRVRTRVKELGYKVLYFPGSRIYHDAEGCVADIVHALEE